MKFIQLSATGAMALFAAHWISAASESSRANHLVHEKSPYLQQHVFNPVDWYPWGTEAFEKARHENKPIFLSIGYSTCHWCHVMERESFTDPITAQILNDNFVCIKVDREERPDVDRVYLNFVESLTGEGGWPMSVWLTPQLKPFFGGTYFPPEDTNGRPGFKTLLRTVATGWRKADGRDTYQKQADEMLSNLQRAAALTNKNEATPAAELRDRGFKGLRDSFDPEYGGFERAPKFPLPVRLEFLFDISATSSDSRQRENAKHMALQTLQAMTDGGIHDQLGGGFHRYSVDRRWRVPHFEKMLYDQAQLANVYLTAWQVSGETIYRETAEDVLRYVQYKLTDSNGGFYSAEDADSASHEARGSAAEVHLPAGVAEEKQEGAFYIWTVDEIDRTLNASRATVFKYSYGIEPRGNALTPSQGEFANQNVPYRAHSIGECAGKFGLKDADVEAALQNAGNALLELREKRPRPSRDEKVITAWNGLMISAYARAAQILDDPAYASMAEHAADFLRQNLYDQKSGRLARSYRTGMKDAQGFAEDYAFLIQGLLDLYEADFDTRWLDWAIALQEKQNELFADTNSGGFFANTTDDKSVLLRLKENFDNAEPSPNSIAVKNLARLSGLLHRDDWYQLAQRTADAFTAQLKRDPLAMPQMLASSAWLEGPAMQIIVQGKADAESTKQLIREIRSKFLPHRVVSLVDAGSRGFFKTRVPFIADFPEATDQTATAYVCENFVCHLPTRDPGVLAKLLDRPLKSAKR